MGDVVADDGGASMRGMGSYGNGGGRGSEVEMFPGSEARGFISPTGAPTRPTASSSPPCPPPPPSSSQIPGDDQSLRPRKFRGFELRFHPAEKVFPQVLDCANPFQGCCKLPEIPIYVSTSSPMVYQGVEYTAITYSLYYVENPSPAFGGLFPRRVGYHEGDVERLTILYSKDPYREWEPCYVYFFAHGNGQGIWLPWGECQHTDDNYLIVYVAKNSHASYYLPGTYVRLFGVANDHCSERGKHLRVSAYLKAFDHRVAKGVELKASACIPPQRSVKPWERFAWPIVAKKVRRDCAKPSPQPRTGPAAAAAAAAALGMPAPEKEHKIGSSCDPPVGLFCGCASLPTPGRQKSKKTQALQVQFSLTYPEQAANVKAHQSGVNRAPIYVFDEGPRKIPERTQPMQVPGPTFEDDATPRHRLSSSARNVPASPQSLSVAREGALPGRAELTSYATSREAGPSVKADADAGREDETQEITGAGSTTPATHLPSSRIQKPLAKPSHTTHSGPADASAIATHTDAAENGPRVERVPVKTVIVKSRLDNQAGSAQAAEDNPPCPASDVQEPELDSCVEPPDASSAASSPSRSDTANPAAAVKDRSSQAQASTPSPPFQRPLDSDNNHESLDSPSRIPEGMTDGGPSPRRSRQKSPSSKQAIGTTGNTSASGVRSNSHANES